MQISANAAFRVHMHANQRHTTGLWRNVSLDGNLLFREGNFERVIDMRSLLSELCLYICSQRREQVEVSFLN